ncbi:acetylxylan esterase precursor [Aspergillus campestris IBT 28561]|uniref:Acetylxylan esterase n=1 Tax=Aspergillus campestris (strain IBT 28561) TaxID=1392248 RepID=A0A2I1DH59_ASPC2|nr:acetylxylan esterase precursor [Aspergillus campestris IBT 28561]PKY09199.1 acetylxylan esterase precursor [Aspergillus campestris IBT 28561]
MLSKLTVLLLASGAIATSETAKHQWGCPRIHIFGARHTGATDDYGGAKEVVELILASNPGATAEPIHYPAMGATKDEFAWSAQLGVQAVTSQVTEFVEACPDTQIVLVGYSQGAEIMDDALCGGPDPTVNISSTEPTISSIVGLHVKAMIWMGNPRYTIGAPFNRGTATASGTRSRSRNLSCAPYTDMIQSYCDKGDKFCTDGDSVAIHASYAAKYKQDAVDFVDLQLS